MAQADGIVSNASGAAVRADLNNQLAAVFTNHSGPTEPSTTYAYQWWADTTNGVMKLRNAANSAWITMFQLDGEWTSLALENGSAASPSIYFKDSGTDTGVYSPGTDQVGISTGGVQRVNFNAATEVVFNDGGNDIDFRIGGDTNPNLFKIDAGTDQVQVANLNGGPLAGTRNRIINGDMRIDQRAAVTTTNSSYTVDRWQLGIVSTGAVQSAQSNDGPAGFPNSLLFDVTTADTSIAAGEYGVLTQYIEGLNASDLAWGTASAQTVTLSFWVKSTTTGTYCLSLRNQANSRSYVATYSVASANTWEYKTVAVPGDTSGTWLTTNSTGISIAFCFAVGSTFQTTAGAWQAGNFLGSSAQVNLLASTANEVRITGVQLEPGTVATPFERRSFGQELALCQRYYDTVSGGKLNATRGFQSDVSVRLNVFFQQSMRAAPVVALLGASGWSVGPTAGDITNRTTLIQGNSTTEAFITGFTASAEL